MALIGRCGRHSPCATQHCKSAPVLSRYQWPTLLLDLHINHRSVPYLCTHTLTACLLLLSLLLSQSILRWMNVAGEHVSGASRGMYGSSQPWLCCSRPHHSYPAVVVCTAVPLLCARG